MNNGMYAEFDGTPRAARAARDLVRHLLGDSHPSVGDAALAASELVANAVAHTRSGQPGGTLILAIEATARPRSVLIRVRDEGAPTAPVLTTASRSSEHGRGLAIIAALAADWGSEPTGTGRSTWCRLSPADSRVGAASRLRQATRDPVVAPLAPCVPELEAGQ